MPQFRYRYFKASTGRLNKGQEYAYDEAELRKSLAARGIKPISIEELPPEGATERQVDYLRALGVVPPKKLTKDEASSLIDNALGKRQPADERVRTLSDGFRVAVDRFASKDKVHRHILADMMNQSSDEALAAWFVYRVYRNGFDRASGQGIEDPGYAAFTAIGRDIAGNPALMKSLRRVAENSPTAFRWFGSFTGKDGRHVYGDSRRTSVYGVAWRGLVSRGMVKDGDDLKPWTGEGGPRVAPDDPRAAALDRAGARLRSLILLVLQAGLAMFVANWLYTFLFG